MKPNILILISFLSCCLFTSQAQNTSTFDYFINNWNVAGLKDYPRGARISPENTILLDESAGAVEIRFGENLNLLSRKQGKLAYDGWMPIILVNADESGIRYEFTIWATPMPDVRDWQKAFDWPTEGENFTVWIRYKVINTSAIQAKAKLYIRINPKGSAGIHFVDMLLKPGESLEQAARYPFYPVKDQSPLLGADYRVWLQRTIDYWNGMKKAIASIEVPEKKVTDALKAAHVCQMIANDLGEVRGGEGFYDEFYIRDGAYQVMELEEAGMWDAARKSIELYLPRQREDGRFESQAGQFDANGQALWVLWQYYKMSADKAFLERVYPAMRKAVDWTIKTLKETQNDPEFPGLLPRALADGEYLWEGQNHIVGYDFWNLRGLLVTADAAKLLGKSDEAADLLKQADHYRNAIDNAMKKNGLGHFPPSWELVGTHWGNTETLWPIPIFPKTDPRVSGLIDFLRKDFAGGYVEGTIRWMGLPDVIHPYMGAYTTMADLSLGNDERVVQDFYWYLLHSTAAHAFPEGIFYKSRTAWGNTIPHVTGACNYAIMLRHMLVHEEGNQLHLLKAVPDWWLADGQQIRIERLPTWFGNVSLIVTGTAKGVEIKFDGPVREKPARIVLHLPDNRPLISDIPGVAVETRKPQQVRWDCEKVVDLYRASAEKPVTTLRFGIMTDVHKDIMFDADQRTQAFVNAMTALNPDFIIELGDFCQPVAKNRGFLDIWNSFRGSRYHVLGNHDMDGGFSRDSTVAFLHSSGRYFSFDKEGFHFVILDCNEANPAPDHQAGYAHFIGTDQQEWLRKDLGLSKFPSVLFSHQPLNSGIDNFKEILQILGESGKTNPAGRVIACFNGHDHADQVKQVNGIWFIQVNSMSYDWLGEQWAHQSYPDSIHATYPAIKFTAPYKDPLWALITLSSDGKISIRGQKTVYVGPSPAELKVPGKGGGVPFSTMIRDTILNFR
ncbi:MAG: metallophosphoesterase family protein [Bacteroidia bacterium]|nr:metallophosphoesterase family protein [Bacteroidia bacterium]